MNDTETGSCPPHCLGIRARSQARSHPYDPGACGLYVRSFILRSARATLAMFNLAIDCKLRGCDLVALRVGDVAPNGYAID